MEHSRSFGIGTMAYVIAVALASIYLGQLMWPDRTFGFRMKLHTPHGQIAAAVALALILLSERLIRSGGATRALGYALVPLSMFFLSYSCYH